MRLLEARGLLLRSLSPELVEAVEQLVAEQVREALDVTPATGTPWLSLDEAAGYLRVSERTLERLIAKGKLRSSTLGRRRLLHRDDLDALARAATGEDVAPTTPPRRHPWRLDRPRGEA